MIFYAVREGHKKGVYKDWVSAKRQVDGYPGAKYKKFNTMEEAKYFLETGKITEKSCTININNNGTLNSIKYTDTHFGASKETGIIEVWTDGSCINNGKTHARAGVGVFFGDGDSRNVSQSLVMEDVSNQKAEIKAIILCTDILLRDENDTSKDVKIIIYTDSSYSINIITKWADKWKQNGFVTVSGQPVKNKHLIKKLISNFFKVKKVYKNIELKHLKAHTSPPDNKNSIKYKLWYGNYQADKLAKRGVIN